MINLYTESFPEQARHSFLKGFMGKFFSAISLIFLVLVCILLPSCGSSSPTKISPEITPTGVSMSPGPNVSLEVGKGVAFSVTPAADKFTFQSSNTAVVTIAENGQACAGTWNSLSVPQVCTPGNPGIAQVTASTLGVTSPPVTIYVHAPITSIAISKVPGQPQTLRTDCISKGTIHGPEKWLFQATAFNGSTDITSSVGPFSFQQINPGSSNIVTLSKPPNGAQGCLLSPQNQCLNQEIVTASTPGISQIYASAGPFVGEPISVETCHVNSISIAAAPDNDPSITSFLVNSGTSTTLNATVTDIAGQQVTGVPLTWSTSNPISVPPISTNNLSSVYGSVGTPNGAGAGQSTVIASCTPPACNAGITPTLPIYPQAAFNFNVRSTATAASPTVYATTTACNTTSATCTPTLVSISRASATAPFVANTPVALLSTPNSLVFDNTGGSAYLGVDSNDFNQKGLMVFNGSTVSQVLKAPGKVLAISPDRNSAVISDTFDSPNLVFICTNCSSSHTITTLQISGATAAAFSPDSLKAYILAGNNVYIYSKLDPLQTITLSPGVVAEDVAFHPEGGFAYLAESSNSLTPYRNCDNATISSAALNTPHTPFLIRPLPDGSTLLVLDPPNIDLISVTSLTAVACTGTITNTTSSFDLGEGSFIPTQFFVSPDGSTAYILGNSSAGPPPSRLPFVMVFNVSTQSASAISLSNSAVPLSASLSPDGKLLFVGADDGTLHVIDTTSGLDIQQVTFPFPTNELCFGPGNPLTQVPLSQVKISEVSQSGSSWAYSYSAISGALKAGQSITISNMSPGGDNGTFTITGFGTDSAGNPTFLVTNSNGAAATNQSGTGTVPISCNPDLVAVKP